MKLERHITPQEMREQMLLEVDRLEDKKQKILKELEDCVECDIAGIRNGCRRHRNLAVQLEEIETEIKTKNANLPMNAEELAEIQDKFEKFKKELGA